MSETVHPLTAWRNRHKVTKQQLANDIGCTRMSIARYENGRMPDQPYLDRIVLITNGEVTANAWLGKEAADALPR